VVAIKFEEDKTKLVLFSKVKRRKGIRQSAFDFLEFTFYLGRSQKGNEIPKIKTSGKRLHSKLKKVNPWGRKVRGLARLSDIWKNIMCPDYRSYQILWYEF